MFLMIEFHLFLPHSDRHHVSSSIPVPTKSQLGVSASSESGYTCPTSSPDRGLRKRASSEVDELKYKPNPPPSYNTAMGEDQTPVGLTPPSPSFKRMSSSLDASLASLNLTKAMQANEEGEQKEEQEQGGQTAEEVEQCRSTDREIRADEDKTEDHPRCSTVATNSSTVQETGEKSVATVQHTGTMNGSLVPGQAPVSLVPELRCSVEQAEEIMGTEATGLGLGLGLGMGLGLADEARLEDFRCIPVDHAVAVECDEQVLGELDVAGFEEFSRRIYALNENTSSFRRPRKNSDKWGRGPKERGRHEKLAQGVRTNSKQRLELRRQRGGHHSLISTSKFIGAILELQPICTYCKHLHSKYS